jgi:hypothetical protein
MVFLFQWWRRHGLYLSVTRRAKSTLWSHRLGAATAPVSVVVNNNGTVIRGSFIVSAQPDIFTSTMGAGGRHWFAT